MGYNMYLLQELDSETLVLKMPELPEEIKITVKSNNTTYSVLASGGIVVPGQKGLRSFSIESYFSSNDAVTSVATIEKMMENQEQYKVPIRVIVNKMNDSYFEYDVNIATVIDEFEQKEVGGEVGDIYFSLKFTEHKEYKAKVISSG